jgi:flagellar basal body rod protein FlgG
VQGEDGDISIPDKITASDITVENDGTLRAGNTTIGRLRLASFANPKDLVRVGPSRFSAPATAVPAEAEDTEVANGMLEGANSSVFEEMSEMIVAMRSFEACQKMLKARDRADELTIEKLAV